MEVRILDVGGFDVASEAMRLSYNSKPTDNTLLESISMGECYKMLREDYYLMQRLARKGDSHGKILRMIQAWIKVKAPRYWWQECATYSAGATYMSESTMHTLLNKKLTQEDFEEPIGEDILEMLNNLIDSKDLYSLKNNLPESFLQTRIMNVNYQTLKRMYFDRKFHKLPQWGVFFKALEDLPFPNLIILDREQVF